MMSVTSVVLGVLIIAYACYFVWMLTAETIPTPMPALVFVQSDVNQTHPQRNSTSQRIRKLADMLQKTYESRGRISKKVIDELHVLTDVLDPRISLSKINKKRKKTRDSNKKNLETQAEELDVCPEEKVEGTDPFHLSDFQIELCKNAKPLHKVITVVINAVDFSVVHLQRIQYIVEGLKTHYGQLTVLVATHSTRMPRVDKSKEFHWVKFVRTNGFISPGATWNMLVRQVQTPYVLVGVDLAHFHNFSRIERQIQMIAETPTVTVVGGSYRNMTGHWRTGCYQSCNKDFSLKYEDGYRYSYRGCMFCDHLEGPFVTRTLLFTHFPFDEKLPKETLFSDWFLQLKGTGVNILLCIDAMYFTWGNDIPARRKKESWAQLGTKWRTSVVSLPTIDHTFTCKEVNITCTDWSDSSVHPKPPCCLPETASREHIDYNKLRIPIF